MSIEKKEKKGLWNAIKPYVYGGMSGMFATCCIQPVDMVKVRIQLLGEGGAKFVTTNPFNVASIVIRKEGVLALYKGLSAALLRQATYTTTRLGLFRTFSNLMKGKEEKPLTYFQKVVASVTAGALGALVGTPADVALVRMQADGTLPPKLRRNYKNVFDAIIRIFEKDGIRGTFRGTLPAMTRAMSLNCGMLATYDQTREILMKYTNDERIINHTAKILSGFFAALFSIPFDFVKTRIQKMKTGSDGKPPYKGLIDCAIKSAKNEGVTVFYRGFWTYYARVAPHAMITLFALEMLYKWFG